MQYDMTLSVCVINLPEGKTSVVMSFDGRNVVCGMTMSCVKIYGVILVSHHVV